MRESIASTKLLLYRPFDVAESKGWVSMAGPTQQMLEKSHLVGIFREPLFPKSRQVVVGFMRCST